MKKVKIDLVQDRSIVVVCDSEESHIMLLITLDKTPVNTKEFVIEQLEHLTDAVKQYVKKYAGP